MRKMLTWLMIAALGGCDDVPRDVAGTSGWIAARRVVRVGIAGTGSVAAERFLTRLGTVTGARIERHRAELEPLVAALDDGRLDVIVAAVRADALLADEIALGPPLDGSDEGDRPLAVRAAVRNGENRWLMTVERTSRESARR